MGELVDEPAAIRERAGRSLTRRAFRRIQRRESSISRMTDWKLKSRRSSCTTCETAFVAGARHASVLSLSGDEFAREDTCVPCFEARDHQGDVFYWFTRHAADRRAVQLDLATLEQLFVQLESRTEQKLCEVRYLLCLLLMRKRRVKLDRIVRGGDAGESMIVHRPRRQESLHVRVFDFDAPRLAELRTELRQIFDGTDFGVPLEAEPRNGDALTAQASTDAQSQE